MEKSIKKIFIIFCLVHSTLLNAQWTPVNIGPTIEQVNSICFPNSQTGYIVGTNGFASKTANGGVNWTSINSNTTEHLNKVLFLDSDRGFVVGNNGVFLKTTNGGSTWIEYILNPATHLYSVFFTNDTTGYVGSGNGILYKTINSAGSWTSYDFGNNMVISSIFFTNENTGFVLCNDYTTNTQIYKTTDAGNSYSLVYSSSSFDLYDIVFTPESGFQTGVAVGKSGTGSARILRTTNGGITWQNIAGGFVGVLRSVHFPSENRGYAVGFDGKMIRTTNAGLSWEPMISQTGKHLMSVRFIAEDTGFVAGAEGLLLRNNIGGLTPATIISQSHSLAKRIGNKCMLNVTAIGTTPLSFQWKKNGVDIPGAIDSILNITNIHFDKEGYYTCTVSNSLRSIVSDTMELSISHIGEVLGDTVNLNITNYVGTVAWQISSDTINWTDIPSSNSAHYEFISNGSTGKKYYRAKIMNPACPNIPVWYSEIIRSYVTDDISKIPPGVVFHGGIVYHTDRQGNGLIVSENDQSTSVTWGCYGEDVYAYSETDGLQNTDEILTSCLQRPIAASICDTIHQNYYSDWFLPASQQISKILPFKDVIGNLEGSYWSSTTGMPSWAWYYYFANPYYNNDFMSIYDKNVSLKTRAIRQFIATENIRKTIYSTTSYQPIPLVTNIISPGDTNLCEGGNLTLISESIGTGNQYEWSYQWKKNNISINGQTPNFGLYSISVDDEGYYKLEANNICGTSVSDSILINVIKITVDAGENSMANYYTICPGASFTLNGSATNNHPEIGTVSYTWTPDSTLSASNILTPTAHPYTPQTYKLTAVHSLGCTAQSTAHTLIIDPTLDAGLPKTINCGESILLNNAELNFENMGTISYQWSPSITLNNDTLFAPIATPTESTYYHITATSSMGCEKSDSILVEVVPLNLNIYDQTIVAGESVEISNMSTNYNGQEPLIYHWSASPWLNDTTIQNPIANPCESTQFYLQITTHNGCTANDSMTLNVSGLSIDLNSQNFYCHDTAQIILSTNYQGTDELSFLWQPSNGLSDSTIYNPTLFIDSAITYSVTVTTQNGCSATNDLITVNVAPFPAHNICIVSVDSTNKNIVIWEDFISQNENIHPEAIDYFNIYRETNITNDYVKIGEVPNDSLHYFIDPTSQPNVQSNRYKISYTDKCGMETILSEHHKTMHLSINQGAGDSWNLIWQQYEGFPVATYNIYRKTDSIAYFELIGTMSGVNNQYNDVTAPAGNVYYQVEVVKQFGSCDPTKSFNSSKSNIASNNMVSIEESKPLNNFVASIMPNPTCDYLWISHNSELPVNITIFDVLGREMWNIQQLEKSKKHDLTNFTKGIYFVLITDGKNQIKQKLVIE